MNITSNLNSSQIQEVSIPDDENEDLSPTSTSSSASNASTEANGSGEADQTTDTNKASEANEFESLDVVEKRIIYRYLYFLRHGGEKAAQKNDFVFWNPFVNPGSSKYYEYCEEIHLLVDKRESKKKSKKLPKYGYYSLGKVSIRICCIDKDSFSILDSHPSLLLLPLSLRNMGRKQSHYMKKSNRGGSNTTSRTQVL